eukprot:200073_1
MGCLFSISLFVLFTSCIGHGGKHNQTAQVGAFHRITHIDGLGQKVKSFLDPMVWVHSNQQHLFYESVAIVDPDHDFWKLLRMFRNVPELFDPTGDYQWFNNIRFNATKDVFDYVCDWNGIQCVWFDDDGSDDTMHGAIINALWKRYRGMVLRICYVKYENDHD